MTGALNRARRVFHREPDFIIGGKEDPYLLRWWVIPRNRFFNIYLHKFLRDDDDRALHDHPWVNVSVVLRGRYKEHVPLWNCCYDHRAAGPTQVKLRRAGNVVFRRPSQAHRIELLPDPERVCVREPAWTLFITGPRVRQWGFLCPQGWRHWQEFTAPDDSSRIGKGCEP